MEIKRIEESAKERITESELYAAIVAAHRRPLPVQPGDITAYTFAQDIGSTVDVARVELDKEVKLGRLVKVQRISENNRPLMAYRLRDAENVKRET